MKETGTILDLVQPELSGKEGYMELAKRAPEPKDNSFLNSVADYAKTALKGTVEGISRLGTMMSHTYETPQFENGKLKPTRSKQQQLEEQTNVLDELLPTDEGFIQSGLRRGLKEAPSMMAFPGSPIQAGARSIGAGFAGETVKELGGSEGIQTAAELTAFIGPDIMKKLLSSGKDKEIIEAGRKFGMTDEQITPLIQSEFKQKWLSKLSPKRGSTAKALENTKNSLSDSYNFIQNAEEAAIEISEKENGNLINKLYSVFRDMPREMQGKIEKDLEDLLNNKITGKTLMNFWKDINSSLGDKTKQFSRLKEPIKDALKTISPDLAKNFEDINKLYTKYYPIASRLKPNLTSDLISAAETLGLLGGITMGYTPSIYAILSEKAAKKLSQQMLINPRLQQLSEKMVKAMNDNKYGIVKKLTEGFSDQLRKEVPEASEILDEITDEELQKFFNHKEKAEQ